MQSEGLAKLGHAALRENPISKEIVDAAFKIHSNLGPGLLESVYEVILAHELKSRGLHVVRQLPVPICLGRHPVRGRIPTRLVGGRQSTG
jgi:GxxExxY protein